MAVWKSNLVIQLNVLLLSGESLLGIVLLGAFFGTIQEQLYWQKCIWI